MLDSSTKSHLKQRPLLPCGINSLTRHERQEGLQLGLPHTPAQLAAWLVLPCIAGEDTSRQQQSPVATTACCLADMHINLCARFQTSQLTHTRLAQL